MFDGPLTPQMVPSSSSEGQGTDKRIGFWRLSLEREQKSFFPLSKKYYGQTNIHTNGVLRWVHHLKESNNIL